jgi:predicted dehydrogenase
MTTRNTIGVAVAGFGWMGRVHTQAYSRLAHHYPSLALRPQLIAIAEDVPGRAEEAAEQFGFSETTSHWQDLATNERVEAVSITAPNFLHREIGVGLAKAGKHIWIEKPVGLTLADAQAVADAVAEAGVQSAVGFNYRNAPAVQTIKKLVDDGELGTLTHVRVRLFSDYAAHPDGALSWRFERARGGNGALGDLASHGADLIRYLVGDITELVADTAIFLPQRPKATGATTGHQRSTGGELGDVENEDFVSALLRFESGARGVLEASRVSVGEQNNYGVEIHGTRGAAFWDFRRMGEVQLSLGGDYQDQALTTRLVGPADGDYSHFQPGTANAMSYDDLKVIEAARFLTSIAEGRPLGATIADAVHSARTLDAITESVSTGNWVSLV